MAATVRNIQIPVRVGDTEAVVEIVRHKPAYTHCQVNSRRDLIGKQPPYNVVIPASGEPRCTCLGHLFNGRCWHVAAAIVAVSQPAQV